MAQVNDPLEGPVIVSREFCKRISPFRACYLLSLFWLFYITLISTVIFAFLRALIWLFGKKKNRVALWIGLWPLITNSFLFVVILTTLIKGRTLYDIFQLFGTMNLFSVLFFVCGIGYALSSAWSVYYIFKNFHVKMSGIFYFHSAFIALVNVLFTLYFLSNGLIGVPTWL